MKENGPSEFEKAASAQSGGGFFGELWAFLKTNKKWWLLPIIIVLLLLCLLVLLGGSGAAVFIYPLF